MHSLKLKVKLKRVLFLDNNQEIFYPCCIVPPQLKSTWGARRGDEHPPKGLNKPKKGNKKENSISNGVVEIKTDINISNKVFTKTQPETRGNRVPNLIPIKAIYCPDSEVLIFYFAIGLFFSQCTPHN